MATSSGHHQVAIDFLVGTAVFVALDKMISGLTTIETKMKLIKVGAAGMVAGFASVGMFHPSRCAPSWPVRA